MWLSIVLPSTGFVTDAVVLYGILIYTVSLLILLFQKTARQFLTFVFERLLCVTIQQLTIKSELNMGFLHSHKSPYF